MAGIDAYLARSADALETISGYDAVGNQSLSGHLLRLTEGLEHIAQNGFAVGLPRTGVMLSSFYTSAIAVTAAQVETALAAASAAGTPLYIDESITLLGDVLVNEKVHIIAAPGVTLTMATAPTWAKGISAGDDTR